MSPESPYKTKQLAVERALAAIHPDRPLCNCRQAYADADGMCRSGCSANQLAAKDEIAMAYLETIRR
jgi:hypothetical protein